MESEYTAMSMAMQSAIPLLAVIESVSGGLKYHQHKLLTFKATIHKDNQGTLILANIENGCHTPRSKLYAIKLHWFLSWLHSLLYPFKGIWHCLWDGSYVSFSLLMTFVQEGVSMYSYVEYQCIHTLISVLNVFMLAKLSNR